jgi:hypothetical protein
LKLCLKHAQRVNVAVLLVVASFSVTFVFAQSPAAQPAPGPPVSSQPASSQPASTEPAASIPAFDDRMFGVIPNYLAVENPQQKVVPLTVKQKFALFAKETVDPYTLAASAAGAALSQINNDDPKY